MKPKKLKLNKTILDKKRKIDKWIKLKHQADVLEKEIQMAETKPYPYEVRELPDYYGEIGCCLTCNEQLKHNIEGIRRGVYLNGKYYDCLCSEGKCTQCIWYDPEERECTRKYEEF